jgi:hypothetical protein
MGKLIYRITRGNNLRSITLGYLLTINTKHDILIQSFIILGKTTYLIFTLYSLTSSACLIAPVNI